MPDRNPADSPAHPAKPPERSESESSHEGLFGTLPSAAGDTSFSCASAPRAGGFGKAAPEVPAEFGRYRILRELGAGAMGIVYLAEDTQLHRQVALKIPQLGNQPDPSRLERFFREARLAATLSHPNICPIYDIGNHDGTHFISMAFVQGRPLSAHLKGGKPIAERTAASLVRKLALALHEAHGHGVIHRDLKPANVMIDQRGEPIVMDFGLARQANGNDEAQITQSGAILGTPAYMSPEQVRGETASVGALADQYALGVILYQMLAGRLPFEGPVVSVLMQIATRNPSPPSLHRPGIHPDLESICLRAMAREAPERFVNTAELASALSQFLRQATTGSDVAASGSAAKKAPVRSVSAGDDAAQPQPRNAEAGQAVSASAQRPAVGPPIPTQFSAGRRPFTRWIVGLTGVAALVIFVLGFIVLPDGGGDGLPISPAEGVVNLAQNSNDLLGAAATTEGNTATGNPLQSEGMPEDLPNLATGPEGSEEPPDWENLPDFSGDRSADDGMPAEGTERSEAVTAAEAEPGDSEVEPPAEEGPTEEEPGEQVAGAKKRKPAKTPVDHFPVGSHWKGKNRQWFRGDKNPKDADIDIQVLERGNGTFRIRYWGGQLSVEVSGRIRNNQIEWTTENAQVTGGAVGRHRFIGKITNGNRLELRFSGQSLSGQGTAGVGTFHRQN